MKAPHGAGEKIVWAGRVLGEVRRAWSRASCRSLVCSPSALAHFVPLTPVQDWKRRVVITSDKTLVRGALLIDDKIEVTGCQEPEWAHLIFARPFQQHCTCFNLNADSPTASGDERKCDANPGRMRCHSLSGASLVPLCAAADSTQLHGRPVLTSWADWRLVFAQSGVPAAGQPCGQAAQLREIGRHAAVTADSQSSSWELGEWVRELRVDEVRRTNQTDALSRCRSCSQPCAIPACSCSCATWASWPQHAPKGVVRRGSAHSCGRWENMAARRYCNTRWAAHGRNWRLPCAWRARGLRMRMGRVRVRTGRSLVQTGRRVPRANSARGAGRSGAGRSTDPMPNARGRAEHDRSGWLPANGRHPPSQASPSDTLQLHGSTAQWHWILMLLQWIHGALRRRALLGCT